jgi:hypothetical protein
LKITTEKLTEQNVQLQQQQDQLKKLRNNLEEIISEKISETQDIAKKLNEYAFVNSHLVRTSLARMLGLINLIAGEGCFVRYPCTASKTTHMKLTIFYEKLNHRSGNDLNMQRYG